MRITPLDIQQKRFATQLRGYKPQEVEAFLDLVASEFEEVIKENIALKEELKRKAEKVLELEGREKALQETMITAQRITDDIKQQAKKEAELVLAEAELQAEKIVQNAHGRLVQIVDDINELRRQRTQFESQLKLVIESHQKLLETMRAEAPAPPPRVDENVKFLAKKAAHE